MTRTLFAALVTCLGLLSGCERYSPAFTLYHSAENQAVSVAGGNIRDGIVATFASKAPDEDNERNCNNARTALSEASKATGSYVCVAGKVPDWAQR